MNDSLSFEQHVVDSLARLETEMSSLTGPDGRVGKLEATVLRLIIGGVVLAVLALGPVAVLGLLR